MTIPSPTPENIVGLQYLPDEVYAQVYALLSALAGESCVATNADEHLVLCGCCGANIVSYVGFQEYKHGMLRLLHGDDCDVLAARVLLAQLPAPAVGA